MDDSWLSALRFCALDKPGNALPQRVGLALHLQFPGDFVGAVGVFDHRETHRLLWQWDKVSAKLDRAIAQRKISGRRPRITLDAGPLSWVLCGRHTSEKSESSRRRDNLPRGAQRPPTDGSAPSAQITPPVQQQKQRDAPADVNDPREEGMHDACADSAAGTHRRPSSDAEAASDRARHRLGGCFDEGVEVDAIDHLTAELESLGEAVVEAQRRALEAPPLPSRIAVFRSQRAAAIAGQVVLHAETGKGEPK